MSNITCPKCGCSPVYMSFMGHVVECSNPKCELYSPDLFRPPVPSGSLGLGLDDLTEEMDTESNLDDTDEDTDPIRRPVYQWITHHWDFGD